MIKNKNIVNFKELSKYADDKNHKMTIENIHTFGGNSEIKEDSSLCLEE